MSVVGIRMDSWDWVPIKSTLLPFVNYPVYLRESLKYPAGGTMHTMALTKDGSVYVWGSNAFGQLGVPEIAKQSEAPVKIPTEV